MFKRMKLATKLACGFGLMVVIAGVLGFVGWYGLSAMSANAALDKQGAQCLDVLNDCAILRRDFAARGFEKAENAAKNSAELWEEAYSGLQVSLASLKSAEGISADNRNSIGAAEVQAKAYRQAFDQQVAARHLMDDAFSTWSKTGWSVTGSVETVLKDVITPARKAAIESANLEAIEKWSEVAIGLDEHIVKPFLLLRVNAVYLIATKADAQWDGYQKQLVTVKANLAEWAGNIKGDPALEAVATELGGYFAQYEEAGNNYRKGIVDVRTANKDMATSAGEVLATVEGLRASLAEEMRAVTAQSKTVMTFGAVAGVFFGVILALLITRSIAGPIKRSVANLAEGAYMVSEAIEQITASSTYLADAATEQASSLEETSAAMEEMAAMTRTNVDNAKEASSLVKVTHHAAHESDKEMVRLNEAMNAINESSGQISKIIKVIEEIAFQTNLLALNAAVEAARAGEHGKGFAVVADEVRNLAQRAAQAAGETTTLIETSVARAREGTEVAGGFGKALSSIVESVTKVSVLVDGIANASSEQAQGVDQINVAIAQMDRVTQALAASAEESAAAVEELSAQAGTVSATSRELAAVVGTNIEALRAQRASASPPTDRPTYTPKSVPPRPQASKPANKSSKSSTSSGSSTPSASSTSSTSSSSKPAKAAKATKAAKPAPKRTPQPASTGAQENFIPLDNDDSISDF